MLTIPRPEAVALPEPVESDGGRWQVRVAVGERGAAHVVAPTQRQVVRDANALRTAAPALERLHRALTANDVVTARDALAKLSSEAAALRRVLIAGYLDEPSCTATQTMLGLTCLAAGRLREARFHLLRAVPGQPEQFAVGRGLRGFRWHPEAAAAALVAGVAMQAVGEAEAARDLLALLREQVEVARIAAICRDFPNHVLWRRPDVLRHVRGVVQVGANVGDEAPCWRDLGIRHLLAFEPVPAAYDTLCATLTQHAPPSADWRALPLAVADRAGSLPFWEGEQTGNSSFLELHPERSEFHQQNRHAHRITVETTTLDRFFASAPELLREHNLIFMDVQGTEHLVIEGALHSLQAFDFVCMELSETEIYRDSWTVDRMDALMHSKGFVKIAAEPNDWPEQLDAIYARTDRLTPNGAVAAADSTAR